MYCHNFPPESFTCVSQYLQLSQKIHVDGYTTLASPRFPLKLNSQTALYLTLSMKIETILDCDFHCMLTTWRRWKIHGQTAVFKMTSCTANLQF